MDAAPAYYVRAQRYHVKEGLTIALVAFLAILTPALAWGTNDGRSTIQGNFRWCDLEAGRLISRNDNCKIARTTEGSGPYEFLWVLHQREHAFNAEAIFCEVKDVTIVWTDHIFSRDSKERKTENIPLTRDA